jgi:hypothetical protein
LQESPKIVSALKQADKRTFSDALNGEEKCGTVKRVSNISSILTIIIIIIIIMSIVSSGT